MENESAQLRQKAFEESWDTVWYLDTGFNNPASPSNRFQLTKLHHFWTKIVASRSALRLLDYGGGPCIHALISASPKTKHIVSSDYVLSNRQALERWQKNDPKAFDWRPFIEYVVKTLEGNDDEEVSKREQDLRTKLKSIVHCDATATNPLPLFADGQGPPFDVISSYFTLEVISSTEREYGRLVKHLAEILNPAGYLMLVGWAVAMPNVDRTSVGIGMGSASVDVAVDAMKQSGLEIVHAEMSGPEDAEFFEEARYYYVVGRRPENVPQ